jgi:hypothetical protein
VKSTDEPTAQEKPRKSEAILTGINSGLEARVINLKVLDILELASDDLRQAKLKVFAPRLNQASDWLLVRARTRM